MSFKKIFKGKLCTFALIASFAMSIPTPAMAFSNSHQDINVDLADQTVVNDRIGIASDTYSGLVYTSGNGGALNITAKVNGTILPSFCNNSITASAGMARGGAIYNTSDIAGISASFTGNKIDITSGAGVDASGGAICNSGTITSIADSSFTGNKANLASLGGSVSGGAIGNNNGTIGSIEDSRFEDNIAYNATTMGSDGVLGGAISNNNGTIGSIIQSNFSHNKAIVAASTAYAEGGAIYNGRAITSINSSSFTENCTSTTASYSLGGAIYNADSGSIAEGIIDTDFTGNYAKSTLADTAGGAIYNAGTIGTITDSNFTGNFVTGQYAAWGGAIYNASSGSITEGIIDTDFTDNYATETAGVSGAQGGAIYTQSNLLIKAENKNVTFRGNYVSAGDPNKARGSAIYVDKTPYPLSPSTLTLNVAQSRKIVFEDDQTIEGDGTHAVAITGGGTVEFSQLNDNKIYTKNSGIYGGTVTVSDGATLALTGEAQIGDITAPTTLILDNGGLDFTRDARAKEYTISKLQLDAGKVGNLKLDVDLAGQTMDTISATDYTGISSTAELHVKTLTLLTDSDQDETPIPFTSNENLKNVTQYDGKEELSTHINKYKVNYDKTTGNFIFTKSGPSNTTTAVGDGVNVTNFVWLETVNNLQKRLGDLRGGEESDMAWARFQRSNDDYDGARPFNVSGNMYQVGYDFALKNQVASRGYFGVSLEAFDGTQSYAIGGGDVKSMSLGAYYTKIYDSGHYFDFILRYGRLENDSTSYDATAGLSGILTKLDYAMNSVTLSGEYGYRWNMGNAGLYLEPQAEFIYGYLSGAQATSSTNYLADIDSTNHFVTRLGLAFGQKVKNFNYYLRGSYYHDFAGTIHVKYGGTPYQQDSAQNWWEVSLGGGWNISKVSYFYAELTKHFKDVSNSLNFNVGFRFTL